MSALKTKFKPHNQLSRKNLLIFALVFAAVGGVLLYKSFALNPNLPGDVNNDNKVDISDLSLLLSHYNQSYSAADFNSDGVVSIFDLSILLSNYGKTYTATTPTATLTANPTSITSGSSSTLTWSSTNSTSCTASGAWTGSKATSATQSVSPTSTSTYSLTCTGTGGNANASAVVTVTTGGGGAADYFVSATGNDSGSCTQSAPCRTLQRAASVAASGSVIEVAAGSYPGQEIRDIHKTITIRSAAGAQPSSPSGQLRTFCVTGITVDNFDSQQMYIGPGSKNVTIKNSAFGGGSWTTGNEADPVVISGDSLNGSCAANGFTNSNITLDNVYIHDYFWNINPGTGPHPDCLQFYGGTNGFTLKNSLIERCAESFVGSYPDFGELHNITFQDTVFRDIDDCSGNSKGAECTYFTTQWNCHSDSHTYGGQSSGPFHWIRTTWTPNVTSGQALGPRTDCPNFTVEDSTFQYGPGTGSCGVWQSLWQNSLVWRNNTFQNGGGCTT